jgi:hypothetical protein
MRRHDQRVSRLKATTAVATYSRDAPPLASQVSAVPAPASLGGAASFSSDLVFMVHVISLCSTLRVHSTHACHPNYPKLILLLLLIP